jgi:hypothetical protein
MQSMHTSNNSAQHGATFRPTDRIMVVIGRWSALTRLNSSNVTGSGLTTEPLESLDLTDMASNTHNRSSIYRSLYNAVRSASNLSDVQATSVCTSDRVSVRNVLFKDRGFIS